MKLLCSREKLKNALASVVSAIPSKSTKPILESIRIEAGKSGIEITATDLELGVRYRLEDVQVSKPGATVVPPKIFDFVRDLSDENVQIQVDGTNCRIQGVSDNCTLVGLNPEEFPKLPEFDEKSSVSIPQTDFVEISKKVSFCASKEVGRYATNGVLLEVTEEGIRMVATDGRRLALAEKPLKTKIKKTPSAIIPTKGITQFLRCLDPESEMVQITISPNQIALRSGNCEVFVRLVEGEFPKYSAVIPKECPNRVEFDREALTQKLHLTANLAGENSRSVLWQINSDSIQLSAHAAGRGEAKASCEAKLLAGSGEMKITLDPDFVIEGLRASSEEISRMEFSDRERPAKFLLGENFVYVVMPITLE